MAAGTHGLLAFWIGGAGAVPAAPAGGNTSMLAPWMGGAAAPSAQQAAVRGLLAFWIGGAAALQGVAPPAPSPPPSQLGGHRLRIPPALRDLQRRRLLEDDELIAAVLIAAIPGLMRRH